MEQAACERLKEVNLKTARAYRLKLNFQEMYRQPPRLAETIWENGISERP
jgi:hypothetical protein